MKQAWRFNRALWKAMWAEGLEFEAMLLMLRAIMALLWFFVGLGPLRSWRCIVGLAFLEFGMSTLLAAGWTKYYNENLKPGVLYYLALEDEETS